MPLQFTPPARPAASTGTGDLSNAAKDALDAIQRIAVAARSIAEQAASSADAAATKVDQAVQKAASADQMASGASGTAGVAQQTAGSAQQQADSAQQLAADAKAAAENARKMAAGVRDTTAGQYQATQDALATHATSLDQAAAELATHAAALDRMTLDLAGLTRSLEAVAQTVGTLPTSQQLAKAVDDAKVALLAAVDAVAAKILVPKAMGSVALIFGGTVAVLAGDVSLSKALEGLKAGELLLWDVTGAAPVGFAVRQVQCTKDGQVDVVVGCPALAVNVTRTLTLRVWALRKP